MKIQETPPKEGEKSYNKVRIERDDLFK